MEKCIILNTATAIARPSDRLHRARRVRLPGVDGISAAREGYGANLVPYAGRGGYAGRSHQRGRVRFSRSLSLFHQLMATSYNEEKDSLPHLAAYRRTV